MIITTVSEPSSPNVFGNNNLVNSKFSSRYIRNFHLDKSSINIEGLESIDKKYPEDYITESMPTSPNQCMNMISIISPNIWPRSNNLFDPTNSEVIKTRIHEIEESIVPSFNNSPRQLSRPNTFPQDISSIHEPLNYLTQSLVFSTALMSLYRGDSCLDSLSGYRSTDRNSGIYRPTSCSTDQRIDPPSLSLSVSSRPDIDMEALRQLLVQNTRYHNPEINPSNPNIRFADFFRDFESLYNIKRRKSQLFMNQSYSPITCQVHFYSESTGLLFLSDEPSGNSNGFNRKYISEPKISRLFQQYPSIYDQLKKPEESFWLDIRDPVDLDMDLLCILFELHPLTLEDIHEREGFEKWESFDHYIFYTFRPLDPAILHQYQPIDSKEADVMDYRASQESFFYKENYLYVLHFPNGIVTIRYTSLSFFSNIVGKLQTLNEIRKSTIIKDSIEEKNHDSIQNDLLPPRDKSWTPDFLAFLIMEEMVDASRPFLKQLQREVDEYNDGSCYLKDQSINNQPSMVWDRLTFLRMASTRKRLNLLSRLLISKLDIIAQYVNRYSEQNSKDLKYKYQFEPDQADSQFKLCDIITRSWTMNNIIILRENTQFIVHQMQNLSETLQHFQSQYSDRKVIELSQLSLSRDRLMKNLAVATTILLPAGIMVDFFGMRIAFPGGPNFEYYDWIPILIHILVMVGIALITWFSVVKFHML